MNEVKNDAAEQSVPVTTSAGKKKGWIFTLVLVLAVIALLVFPFFINSGSEFGGSDDAGSDAIAELDPGYQVWFHPLWTPPGSEIESLLFALQAGFGAGVIGYFFGSKRGEKKILKKLGMQNTASGKRPLTTEYQE